MMKVILKNESYHSIRFAILGILLHNNGSLKEIVNDISA